MKNLSIRSKLLSSFILIVATIVVMAGIAYTRLSAIEVDAANLHTHSLPGLSYSTQLLSAFDKNFSITQELVIQENKSEFDKIQAELQPSRGEIKDLIARLRAHMDASQDGERLDALDGLLGSYARIQEEVTQLGGGLRNQEAQAMLRALLDPEFDKVHDTIEQIVDASKAEADESARLITASVTSAKTGIMISSLIALVIAFASGVYLLRSVTKPLGWLVGVMDRMREGDFTQRIDRRDEFAALGEGFNRMADELTVLFGDVQKSGLEIGTSVTEIAATARQQQATASEIAATTSEIGATSREISATSKDLFKTMSEVASVAEGTATLAGHGQTGVSHMEETMRRVMEAAGSVNAKLAVLNEKAGSINQVVTTIAKVADQTNLLSLNAAIEAEKAGEYGRGFAAVAAEIRRLADQTAVATYDIEQMVKEIQSAVSAGVMGMDKFSEEVRRGVHDVQEVGGQLSQIILQVQALVPRIETVNEGMNAQATGAEQISEALVQLTDAAQQTVDSLSQSSMAIDDLNRVSGTLRSGVTRFKLAA